MKRLFFPGLNELRAIAAFAVIIHHIELYKNRDGIKSLYNTRLYNLINHLGENGVYLFFVLSGFLITYLLLTEYTQTGKIHFKEFYLRRILRIWPLYYFLLVICFFLIPILVYGNSFFGETYYTNIISEIHKDFNPKLLLFLLFLPNLALVLYKPVAGLAQSWSVGVEEQFYIFWPLLIVSCRKYIWQALLILCVGKPSLLFLLSYFNQSLQIHQLDILIRFLTIFKIELMALGGLGAFFLYKLPNVSKTRFRKSFSYMMLVLIFFAGYLELNYLIMGLLFLGLILLTVNQSSNIFESYILSSLGRISYGLYMYHPLMMFFCFSLLYKYHLFNNHPLGANLIIYILILGSSLLISKLSYRFLELPFLKLKRQHTIIKSGDKV
jgi:peptidoglycan/LPS O-acetylase OafA/YrhL